MFGLQRKGKEGKYLGMKNNWYLEEVSRRNKKENIWRKKEKEKPKKKKKKKKKPTRPPPTTPPTPQLTQLTKEGSGRYDPRSLGNNNGYSCTEFD